MGPEGQIDHNTVHDAADLDPARTAEYGGEYVATAAEDDNPPASAGALAEETFPAADPDGAQEGGILDAQPQPEVSE